MVNQVVVYTIPEACQAVKVSRTLMYEAIKAGELRITKLGRRTLIRREALEDWLKQAEQSTARTWYDEIVVV